MRKHRCMQEAFSICRWIKGDGRVEVKLDKRGGVGARLYPGDPLSLQSEVPSVASCFLHERGGASGARLLMHTSCFCCEARGKLANSRIHHIAAPPTYESKCIHFKSTAVSLRWRRLAFPQGSSRDSEHSTAEERAMAMGLVKKKWQKARKRCTSCR